jgi:hypothetical protein
LAILKSMKAAACFVRGVLSYLAGSRKFTKAAAPQTRGLGKLAFYPSHQQQIKSGKELTAANPAAIADPPDMA